MNFLSLFSGIGGFEIGMQASDRAFNCVGYSEIDSYALSIYKKHFPNHLSLGDVTQLNVDDLPDFDMLVAGFPCQAFSAAGLRKGFNDTRGTLFFEIARILRAKRPQYFLLENVKGLLSHDKGNTFQVIVNILDGLGYNIRWDILNSKDFGVPQSRERIYIRGSLDKIPNDISLVEDVGHNVVDYVVKGRQGERILDEDGISQTLAASGGNRGSRTFVRTKDNNIKIAMRHNYRSSSILDDAGITPTLCASNYKHPLKIKTKHGVTSDMEGILDDGYCIRKLTPVECERLQGFPDDWTKEGADGELMSDTQRYKTCGNAVTTNVIKYIMNEWQI